MEQLKHDIGAVINFEKIRADEEHGPILSAHEGYGVLAEEVQEMMEHVLTFDPQNKYNMMEDLLRSVRSEIHAGIEYNLQCLYEHAV